MARPMYACLSVLIVWVLMHSPLPTPPCVIEEVAKFGTIAVSPIFGVVYLYVFVTIECVLYVANALVSGMYSTDFVIMRALVIVMHLTTGYLMLKARAVNQYAFVAALCAGIAIHWAWNAGPLQQIAVNILRFLIGESLVPIF